MMDIFKELKDLIDACEARKEIGGLFDLKYAINTELKNMDARLKRNNEILDGNSMYVRNDSPSSVVSKLVAYAENQRIQALQYDFTRASKYLAVKLLSYNDYAACYEGGGFDLRHGFLNIVNQWE